MDYELSADQQAIVESVQRLLRQQAGPARAIELNRDSGYDTALDDALAAAGFCDVAAELATDGKPASLEAALVVEAIARAGGVVAGAARIMVLPALSERRVDGPLALCTRAEIDSGTPLRFGAHARHLLILDEYSVSLAPVSHGDLQAVRSSFGFPMGRVVQPRSFADSAATRLGGEDVAQRMRNWWRLALAVEAVGTMEAALAHTVDYLQQRRQFGRAIGSFQAIQHRLALCAIQVEASRWLAREAAYHGARAEGAACAAAFALEAAEQLFGETHQMSGAIGFTREFDLHVWSMRLLALRQELHGVGGARRALVAARWGAQA